MTQVLENLYQENEEEKQSSIYDLKPKMRLQGAVSRVELFGAFVDVGVDKYGLLHISQLSTRRVNRVSEVVKEGDPVTVWVLGVDPDKGRIDLTMIEPPAVDWDEIRGGQVYNGTIKRLENFGAFVDIGATRDGLVHVSEITTDYIQDPKECLKVGDEVQVKVLKVDRKRRRIELSIKALEDHLVEEEDDENLEDAPTAMELAWRQAQTGRGKRRGDKQHKKGRAWQDKDDVFARTLRLQDDQN